MTDIKISDSDYIISDVKVKTLTPNFYTESLTGKGNAKSRGLHSLEFSFKITLINDRDVKRFNALMLKLKGRLNPFKLSLLDKTDGANHFNPLFSNSRIRLTSLANVGDTHIQIASVGFVEAGTMFQLPNDSKVYTILDDVTSGGSVEIFPAIRVTHEVNTNLITSVEPKLRLTSDFYENTYDKVSEITLSAKEVL
ncbi:hypothetical protein [Vibrio parahaemolyticus]|uniref:hypothetical protein n=1 Tax=Vibrio parahaemolyticus TaxID=670 RepID=UPI0005F24842|nr:hypothetical protein [Vibrio parahaemolyticus]KJR15234.1 hypothetical protein UF28_16340 [Vibrio parahaemolyticus]